MNTGSEGAESIDLEDDFCPKCKGDGLIEVFPTDEITDVIPCDKCNGNGRIR